MYIFAFTNACERRPQVTGFQCDIVPGGKPRFYFIHIADAALLIHEIRPVKSSLKGKALNVVLLERAQAMDAKHLKPGGCHAFEKHIAVDVRKIVATGLRHVPCKVHVALIIDVEELQGGDQGCFPNVIGPDKVQWTHHFHFTVIIYPCMDQYEACGADDAHESTSSSTSTGRASASTS